MPNLTFLSAPAFDLFASLYVLHRPREFGLRPAWAAGIRSRVPAPWRGLLETYHSFLPVPLAWVEQLPAPAGAAAALTALRGLPPAGRLPALFLSPEGDPRLSDRLAGIAARGSWDPADLEALRSLSPRQELTNAGLANLCAAWTRLDAAGEEYLAALNAYVEAFFAGEEQRITPLLAASLDETRALAQRLPLDALIERISRGIELTLAADLEELCLAPSYWGSPFIFLSRAVPRRMLLLYGARPERLSPGEEDPAPEGLLRGLNALSDPTRLRILAYLSHEPQTPTQLAARLRLRAPTITHHLRQLRLAGLVRITLEAPGSRNERRYALRREALRGVWSDLEHYLEDE